jgi:glutaredoxin-like protein NrdH
MKNKDVRKPSPASFSGGSRAPGKPEMTDTTSVPEVVLYSLTTCSHCKALRRYLDSRGVAYELIYVDMLFGEERNCVRRRLRHLNPAFTFPTTVVGEAVVAGFKEEVLASALSDLKKKR